MRCTWICVGGIAIAVGCGPVVGTTEGDGDTGSFDDDDDGSDADSAEGSSDGESDGAGDGSIDETGAPTPSGCGDGIVDVGEICDDGDALDGNGCNNDCRPSGQLLWSDRYGDDVADYGHAVALDSAGNVWLGVSAVDGGFLQTAHLRAYTAAGELRWHVAAPRTDELQQAARSIAIDDDGNAVLAIAAAREQQRSLSELVHWNFDGAQVGGTAHAFGGGVVDPVGVVFDAGERLIVAGAQFLPSGGSNLWLEGYEGDALQASVATQVQTWPAALVADGTDGAVVALASTASQGSELLRVDATGNHVPIATLPCGRAVASDIAGSIWGAGDDGNGTMLACSIGLDGTPGPAFSFAAPDFYLSALAVADGGDVIFVGYVLDTPGFLRVERRTPDGTLRWSFSPNEEILAFDVATRPGVPAIAISGVTLENEANASVIVLSP